MKKIDNIQKILNVNFKNESLLKRAITHKSYNSKSNYEKLEFLGDRVLGLVISKKLLEIYLFLLGKISSNVNTSILFLPQKTFLIFDSFDLIISLLFKYKFESIN